MKHSSYWRAATLITAITVLFLSCSTDDDARQQSRTSDTSIAAQSEAKQEQPATSYRAG